jgi:hypothetical protein
MVMATVAPPSSAYRSTPNQPKTLMLTVCTRTRCAHGIHPFDARDMDLCARDP